MKIEFEIKIGSFSEDEAKRFISESFSAQIAKYSKAPVSDKPDDVITMFLSALTQKALENGCKRIAMRDAISRASDEYKEKMK
jgi:hypothetical protein